MRRIGGLALKIPQGKEEKRKKWAPLARKKHSRNSCVLPAENCFCVPRVIVFPTRMADVSSLLRLLPVVARMALVYHERVPRARILRGC